MIQSIASPAGVTRLLLSNVRWLEPWNDYNAMTTNTSTDLCFVLSDQGGSNFNLSNCSLTLTLATNKGNYMLYIITREDTTIPHDQDAGIKKNFGNETDKYSLQYNCHSTVTN